jgi:hypothetical protein
MPFLIYSKQSFYPKTERRISIFKKSFKSLYPNAVILLIVVEGSVPWTNGFGCATLLVGGSHTQMI